VKKLFLLCSLPFFCAGLAHGELNWLTDFEAARAKAKADNKLLLVDFTGSDWCGYCVKMDREVLSKPEFEQYASKNLVLLEVDFPRAKEQSVALRTQNRKLAGQFGIEGFPTFIVLDGDGKKVWSYEGYFPGGPGAFIAALERLRKS
jgi:protein disulfide-isomerase